MTLETRIRRARATLVSGAIGTGVLYGATAGMIIMTLGGAWNAAIGGAAVVVALTLWVRRAIWSLARVALWVEERQSDLHYALVTALDPALPVPDPDSDLGRVASRAALERVTRDAALRWVGRACIPAVSAALVMLALRPPVGSRGIRDTRRAPAEAPNRLVPLAARVEPPAYTRWPAITLHEPANITALIGTGITLAGAGAPDGITLIMGNDTLAATGGDGRWSVRLAMPRAPIALTLRDRRYRRLLALEPRIDSAPRVTLDIPAHDTTYRDPPTGKMTLEAHATDDIGLDYGYFDFLLSSGSEENFQTESRVGARIPLGNTRLAPLRMTIDFDTLRLRPGSILHIRAVAVDGNTVTGPGRGFSETRTLRVVSAHEYDSVAVDAAAPLPIDTLFMSQRVLNMRTDTLIRAAPRMTRAALVDRSGAYADIQETIRQRVEGVIGLLEDNGVGGRATTAESELLHQASEQMFDARGMLGIAEPEHAMPYMKRALKLLDEARKAQRYYIRGVLRPNVVNVAHVRLQGKDTAAAADRMPRHPVGDVGALLRRRLDDAMRLMALAPRAAVDSLLVIRVAALTEAPAAAPGLERAIEALPSDPSRASGELLRAWRLLAPPTHVRTEASAWLGAAAPSP